MKSFLLALQFLTIIPARIKKIAPGEMARAAAYFPAIGLLLGLVLWSVNHLLSLAQFDPVPSNIMLVVLLVILTGGLHLDGLSDTSDAIFSGKGKTDMLAIMRDPHTGVMGVLAIVSILMLKVAFLSSILPNTKGIALVLMCVLARWSISFSVFAFPYARDDGKAKPFMDGTNRSIFFFATLIALAIVFIISKTAGLAIFGMIAAIAYLANSFIKKKIGGITGDTIGAVNELVETAVLSGVVILQRIIL